MVQNERSMIVANVDFEQQGKQIGFLRLPYSHDRSAYGYIPIPIAVLNHGTGPTVLLTGANHGDEYEGPVALMRLVNRIDVSSLRGRIIVVPALNMPAYLNGTRTSPIDKGNLNRTFPGNRNGTVTEMLAHYIESELIPLADYVLDFHSGGTSLSYLPSLFIDPAFTGEARQKIESLAIAFAPPRIVRWNRLGESRVMSAAARRCGKIFLTGEFGGAASVSPDGVAVVEQGVLGVLDELDMLSSPTRARSPEHIQHLQVRGAEDYVFTPRSGIFESLFRLGDEVKAGQQAGRIYDPYAPWAEPVSVPFSATGIVICIRPLALVQTGDCLGHVAESFDA
jgi:predicted deacylase